MTSQQQPLPSPEILEKTVKNLRAVCRQLNELNLLLDEAIAIAEEAKRSSPLTLYRLGKKK